MKQSMEVETQTLYQSRQRRPCRRPPLQWHHIKDHHSCLLSHYLCLQPYGPSMLPTLNMNGELVLADRLSTRFGKVRRGDIVIVRLPLDPRKVVAKRVMGMEGDFVTYVVDPTNSDRCETIVVPKGRVWIEGDSIYVSNDSRQFGPVPYGLVLGKVFWRGIVSGINVARHSNRKSLIVLERESRYIGTLTDDLVTKDLCEPYRMLTRSYCLSTKEAH